MFLFYMYYLLVNCLRDACPGIIIIIIIIIIIMIIIIIIISIFKEDNVFSMEQCG